MLESKEIITYIFVIGAAQAVFLFFVLWKKKENDFANKFLAVTMLVFAVDLLAGVALLSNYISNIPWVLGINNSLPYLYGPLIYLYVIFLIRKQNSFNKNNFLHFIPFLLVQVYGILFFYFESTEYQLKLLNLNFQQVWHIQLISNLIPIHGSIYITFTILEVVKFNKKIKDSFSKIEHIDLSWLLYLVVGVFVIWLVVIFSYIFNFIYGDTLLANVMIYIVLSIFLYSLAIKSYRQPEIERITDLQNINERSYKKSGLDENIAIEYLMLIQNFMKNEKPYLNSELNLTQLANSLNISIHNLSEVINTKLNQNFYEFINKYRVEEVKKLIIEDLEKKFSILAHGYEAGFSSKSAFYSAFKKYTGMTPAQFQKGRS